MAPQGSARTSEGETLFGDTQEASQNLADDPVISSSSKSFSVIMVMIDNAR